MKSGSLFPVFAAKNVQNNIGLNGS